MPRRYRDRGPASRPPLVERVGLALLVAAAVGELDDDAAASLVEAARAGVLLEDPEAEALGPPLGDALEERRADPASLRRRIDVEEPEQVAVEACEAGQPAVLVLGDPDLLPRDHAAEEGAILIRRVERRQEPDRLVRPPEHGRQCLGVLGHRTP